VARVPGVSNVSLISGGTRDQLRRLESGLLGTAISRHRYTHIGAVCGPSQRTQQRSTTRYNADQRQTMCADQRQPQGSDQEACLISQKILSISNDPALAGRADLRDSQPPELLRRGPGRQSVTSRRPPSGTTTRQPGDRAARGRSSPVEGCPRAGAWSGYARPTGCHTLPTSKIVNDHDEQ
jgi:hypothetical protein